MDGIDHTSSCRYLHDFYTGIPLVDRGTKGVNNLPKVVPQQCPSGSPDLRPLDR